MVLYQLSYGGTNQTIADGFDEGFAFEARIDILSANRLVQSPMADSVAAVFDKARSRVDPTDDERAALARVTETLIERAHAAIADLPVEAEVLHVGSTARDTWVSGDRDIDLFVRFPTTLDREQLSTYGLEVGHAVLPDGQEEYAEHPYVTGQFDGFDVDLVPCYDVESAASIRSAVDRTPFHNEYLSAQLTPELAADVRLVKGFARGTGVYGSDLRTRGFSGYLIELLVVHYGGAKSLLTAAADWRPPVELDPAQHQAASFEDPLVVIDPTDPTRNVAAVLSETAFARFQHHARSFLAAPSIEDFEPTSPGPLDAETLVAHLDRRETTVIGLTFPLPTLVEDDLYPQLRTSRDGIVAGLERAGFSVLRSTVGAVDGTGLILIEFSVAKRPAIERHTGPPVSVRSHAEAFYEKYADDPDVYGPFLDGDQYVVERPRSIRTATGWLRSDALFTVKHGAQIKPALNQDHAIYIDTELLELLPEFGAVFTDYFDPAV